MGQTRDRVGDLDLAVVVEVRGVLTRRREGSEELERQVVDRIGDFESAVAVGVTSPEVRTVWWLDDAFVSNLLELRLGQGGAEDQDVVDEPEPAFE
jgi:hypothetical protein